MKSPSDLIKILQTEGGKAYGTGAVTQLEHSLQCAALAELEDGRPAMILASLLHDIGHLLHAFERDIFKRDFDDRHETIAANLLQRWFAPDVVEPIRLHVAAKRYLCTADPGYWDRLSAGSKRTLQVQGGPFTSDEAGAFIAQPFATDAVALRRWDDRAKVGGLTVPEISRYETLLATLASSETPRQRTPVTL